MKLTTSRFVDTGVLGQKQFTMVREVAACNVIYVDRRVRHERVIGRRNPLDALKLSGDEAEHDTVITNTQALLSVFKSGKYCSYYSQYSFTNVKLQSRYIDLAHLVYHH